MKKNVLISALALLGMSSAFASSYIKAEVQRSINDTASDYCKEAYRCTENPTGYRLAYGYSFNDYIALELGYGETGEFLEIDGLSTFGVELSNIDLAAIGRVPVNDFFAITGKLGLNRSDATTNIDIDYWNYSDSDDRSSTVFVYGVGMEFSWFTLGYEVINNAEIGLFDGDYDKDDFERLYAGVKFTF